MRLCSAKASWDQNLLRLHLLVLYSMKPSLLPTLTPLARLTVKTSAKIRNQNPDEINAFNNQDENLDFKSFTA